MDCKKYEMNLLLVTIKTLLNLLWENEGIIIHISELSNNYKFHLKMILITKIYKIFNKSIPGQYWLFNKILKSKLKKKSRLPYKNN